MKRTDITGNLKRLYWTTGTIVPTGAGLRPALVPEKFYVQTGTEAEAFAFTDFDKPWGSRGESFAIDAFGHEKDLIHGDFGKFQEERFNFDQIVVA